jgi:hypothetical protein
VASYRINVKVLKGKREKQILKATAASGEVSG